MLVCKQSETILKNDLACKSSLETIMTKIKVLRNTPEDEYLTEEHLEYFNQRLRSWRQELVAASNEILNDLKFTELRESDPIDYGSLHAEKERNLLNSRRNRKLIARIEHALYRIKQGDFGYCELTGEEIGIERLMALPIATLSVEAQESLERQQAVSF